MAKPLLVIGNRNYSSWSFRAWLILKKAAIEFEEVRIPLFVAGFENDIRKYSPAGKVPILQDGDSLVWDSMAIAEYVAERVPRLWPDDIKTKAMARSIAAEMHSGFAGIRSAMPMNCRAVRRKVDITTEVAVEIRRIQQLVSDCRSRDAAFGPWLFGAFSIADAMYVPIISRFVTYGVESDSIVTEYTETVMNEPYVMEWYSGAEAETEIIEMAEVG